MTVAKRRTPGPLPLKPLNASKRAESIAGLGKNGRSKNADSSKLAQLEEKRATQEALFKFLTAKSKAAPTSALTKENITYIIATDYLDEMEAALYELVMFLNFMS